MTKGPRPPQAGGRVSHALRHTRPHLASGETDVLKWQHGENKDKRVLPILHHTLQGKLQEGR